MKRSRVMSAAGTLWLASLIVPGITAHSEDVTLTIQADRPGARISPTLWGLFFEDINFGGDGGLYPELVKNRSFEFPDPLMAWRETGKSGAAVAVSATDESPFHPANPHHLRVKAAGGGAAVENEGFRGMGVVEGAGYRFSAFARCVQGGPLALRIELVRRDPAKGGAAEIVVAEAELDDFGGEWKKHECRMVPSATEARAILRLSVEGSGTLDLDMVSLVPEATWKGRPNGLRADLVQLLADLKPGFLRFPGGCIVEGRDLSKRYQWKTTIGDLAERRLIVNRWNDEFKHRPTPDYFQTFGLGFFEYFLLCEDIGAEPLPILNCGMACQFNTGELVPLGELEPFIQDALDLIEFANGPVTSPWGKRRAELGHPEPFGLELLGIGNEQWGPQYFERYEKFAKVLKEKHPEVLLVSSAGPAPADERFHSAWKELRRLDADIVDEHCYAKPEWFLDSAGRYDRYDRTGPKVFMGEYAAQSVATVSPENRGNWECALAEAAFMTGLERNADVVTMSSYAPLSGHVDAWQWKPNLIWFDNLRSYGTPSYYVQQLFSVNRGNVVLPVKVEGQETPSSKKPGLYVTAARDEESGEIILKVVNTAAAPVRARVVVRGASSVSPDGIEVVLSGGSLSDENSLESPRKVAPTRATAAGLGPRFVREFRQWSLTVLRFRTQ